MYDDQPNYWDMQRRAAQAAKKQQARVRIGLFLAHIFLFVVFLFISLGISAGRSSDSGAFVIGMLLVIVGWFTSLFLHGASVWMQSERGERGMQQRAMAREIARFNLDQDNDEIPVWNEKAKRRTRLTEDGELLDIVDEQADDLPIKRALR
jgi:hypothetical protein